MDSLWSDGDAEAMVARYGEAGVGRDLALRVYTSRLLGGDPRLVLHGGGNTSVKTVLPDLLGDPVDVLCVKGSGWKFMVGIRPPGLPAVRLAPLRKLRARAALADEEYGAHPARQPHRSGRAQPVGRNPAARRSAPQIIDPPVQRRESLFSLADFSPMRPGALPISTGRASGWCPTSCPACRSPRRRPKSSKPIPRSRAWCWSSTASSPSAPTRAAYERMIALVTLAERRLVNVT